MREILTRRLSFVGFLLLTFTALIVYRLVSLQFGVDTAFFAEKALTEYRDQVTIIPPRGEIYDRSGVLMATNAIEYEIGLSPVLILDRQSTADQLNQATGIPVDELLNDMSGPQPYVLLVRPAPASMGQAVLALGLDGVVVTPIPRRFYPHGDLASQVLGFVALDNQGYYGIEGYYDDILQGQVQVEEQSNIPFDVTGGQGWVPGATLYLTIDSEIQYLAETTLQQALQDTGAASGTIIIMQPRTGEILAMANEPSFDPNRFASTDASLFENPAINRQYEPGSVMKVATMAIALDNGIVTPDTTYNDTGVIEVGGAEIHNWDLAAHGITDMTQLLAKSLNVGAATISVRMGPSMFYQGLTAFGFGQPTGVDLAGEISGSVKHPGDANWFESDLGTNAFGQGLATTPLQVITAINAVANDGLLLRPRIVSRRINPDGTAITFDTDVIGRAIRPETAHTLSTMLQNALSQEASSALVPGYSIAGKTGTAQIPIPGGYDPDHTITSFVGYGPVDDPQFIVLVKLDTPTSSPWGSQTAAPVFSKLVQRLVVLMEIPPNSIRLSQTGG